MSGGGEAKSDGKDGLFALFPKFVFRIPFLNKDVKPEVKHDMAEDVAVAENEGQKVGRVSFPIVSNKVAESLEVEAEDGVGRTSNPIVLWQVYALGGFLVLQWVWARWKERKERGAKNNSLDNDEEIPALDDDDFQE